MYVSASIHLKRIKLHQSMYPVSQGHLPQNWITLIYTHLFTTLCFRSRMHISARHWVSITLHRTMYPITLRHFLYYRIRYVQGSHVYFSSRTSQKYQASTKHMFNESNSYKIINNGICISQSPSISETSIPSDHVSYHSKSPPQKIGHIDLSLHLKFSRYLRSMTLLESMYSITQDHFPKNWNTVTYIYKNIYNAIHNFKVTIRIISNTVVNFNVHMSTRNSMYVSLR